MSDTWQPFIPHLHKNGLLNPFYQAAVTNQLPIALWRFPRVAEKYGVVDLSGNHCVESVNFDTMSPGFVIAPFQPDPEHKAYFFQANLYLNTHLPSIHENLALNHDPLVSVNRSRFAATFRQYGRTNGTVPERPGLWYVVPNHSGQADPIAADEYCRWIAEAVDTIRSGVLTKVVLSRSVEVGLPAAFHPLRHFCKLCDAYPNAFVSLVAIPGIGTWLGVTPELFLHVNGDKMTTVSLAATQEKSELARLPEWGRKEIDEQEIVSDYIRNCFFEHAIQDFVEHPLETVQIGNLCHLQTKFSYHFPAPQDKHFVSPFLQSMHPTPAVCGVSKEMALRFIKGHERHQRSFYSGYLGPVNLGHESNFYVNLRCMQLHHTSATLYAGGGITRDSIPEHEWLETELKLNTLLQYLHPDRSSKKAKRKSIIE